MARWSKVTQWRVFRRRCRAMSSYRGCLGYSLSQSLLLIFSYMFSYSHSRFSRRMEKSASLLFMRSLMYCTNSKKTSFTPILSYAMLKRSFTSGRLQSISENFMMLLMWGQYFERDFYGYPVSDLMNQRLRAVCMHLLWFYSHSLSRYYSLTSFIRFVFKISYFSRLFGDVRQRRIQCLLKNSYSFRLFTSSLISSSFVASLFAWNSILVIARRQQSFKPLQVSRNIFNLCLVSSQSSMATCFSLSFRLRTCKYYNFRSKGMLSIEQRVAVSFEKYRHEKKSSRWFES